MLFGDLSQQNNLLSNRQLASYRIIMFILLIDFNNQIIGLVMYAYKLMGV